MFTLLVLLFFLEILKKKKKALKMTSQKKKKKGLKMISQLVIFRAFFFFNWSFSELFFFFFVPSTLNLKKNPINQLIKKFWPDLVPIGTDDPQIIKMVQTITLYKKFWVLRGFKSRVFTNKNHALLY